MYKKPKISKTWRSKVNRNKQGLKRTLFNGTNIIVSSCRRPMLLCFVLYLRKIVLLKSCILYCLVPLNSILLKPCLFRYVYTKQDTCICHTGPDGTVAMSSVNGLVGTGFASRYRLQPRAVPVGVGRCKAITPSSFSLTSNGVTTNY